MANDILFSALVITFLIMIWSVIFFIFDNEILNGYFKKKLQKRFNVEEIQ